MWITLQSSAVQGALTSTEATALSTYLLAEGASDPLTEVVARTCAEVRGYVAVRYGTAVGEAGTVPEELESAAISVARWRLLTRLAAGRAAQVLLTEGRRKEYEDAVVLLRDVAAGKFAIAAPVTQNTEQARPPATGVFGSRTNFTVDPTSTL